jgi:hypothetical protein
VFAGLDRAAFWHDAHMVAWGGDGSGKEPTKGADPVAEMGEGQAPARTTRDYAVHLLRRYGNGPTIRRVFLAGGAVGVSLVIALVIAGGLGFKREIDYVECERFAVPFASVHIQNSPKGSGWGNPAFLAYSSYGPPYDLLMYGTLAEGDAATSFQLNDLVVETDGSPAVKLPPVDVAVEDLVVRQDGVRRPARGFLYRQRAITSATPTRLRVTGTLTEVAPIAGKPQHFTYVFEAHRVSRLTLGRWSWSF